MQSFQYYYTLHIQHIQSVGETSSQANVFPSPDYDTLRPKDDAEEGSAAAECQDSVPARDDVLYMAATLDQEEMVHIDGDMMVGIRLLCPIILHLVQFRMAALSNHHT